MWQQDSRIYKLKKLKYTIMYKSIIATLFFFPIIVNAQLSIEEHLQMEQLGGLATAGDQLIYSHTSKQQWDGRSTSSIIIYDKQSGNSRALTEAEYDYAPLGSPSGNYISFISYRNNLQQLYIVPKAGGDARMVSDAQAYLSNYDWMDEQTLAYVDDEPRDSVLVAQENANGGGYWVGTEFFTNALWSYDLKTGQKKKITDGSFRIINLDISPDGRYAAFTAAKNYDTYEAITNNWVEVIEIASARTIYKFANANALNHPTFSPDGKQLAFAGSSEGYACNDGLFVAELSTGLTQNLTYDFDPTVEHIRWLDSERLCFSTPRNGYTGIYEVNREGIISTLVAPYWVIDNFQATDNGLYFIGSHATSLPQLYHLIIGQDPHEARPLTQLNADLTPKIKTQSSLLNYQSADNTTVQGIVTFPPQYDSTQAYPLMVIPHGGPDAVELNGFDRFSQFFADQGYLVLRPNFRGSIGYGRAFYAGNQNAFGVTDFADIMAGVNELIKLGVADSNRMVIGGWSYGGYLANWAITQTDRFKAAISIAGISNLVSLYGQHEFSNREIGLWEYQARPIDQVENYRKASPIFFVKNADTPLLILHGENDSRSPTLQAWEMHRAMKDAGKPVEMMLYPRAGHGISRPIQQRSVLNNWLAWAEKCTQQ